MCLKRLITVPFKRSEPFHLLRMMGVSVPSLHIESTDSMITFLFSVLKEVNKRFCTLLQHLCEAFPQRTMDLKEYFVNVVGGTEALKKYIQTPVNVFEILDVVLKFHLIDCINYHVLEDCLIVLVPDDSPHYLKMAREYGEKLDSDIWSMSLAEFVSSREVTCLQRHIPPKVTLGHLQSKVILVDDLDQCFIQMMCTFSNKILSSMKDVKEMTKAIGGYFKVPRHAILLRLVDLHENIVNVSYDIVLGFVEIILEGMKDSSFTKWCNDKNVEIQFNSEVRSLE